MIASPGTGESTDFFFGQVRYRVLISMLAALLGLANVGLLQHTVPNGARGNYTTLVAAGGTRIKLACEGSGPVTVAMIDPAGLSTAIDSAVHDELARSVRLCRIDLAEPADQPTPNLTRVLPAALYAERVPAPFVIVTSPLQSPTYNGGTESTPFIDLIAGWVFVTPMPAPATGVVMRADGSTWSLPVGDTTGTALAILKTFWPPEA
jgi:hypothetical protein